MFLEGGLFLYHFQNPICKINTFGPMAGRIQTSKKVKLLNHKI